jgi:acyl CoA:acetate/3-ketoacid CoA transferase beta subunit
VFIILEHNTRDGSPRLIDRCALPVTARGVVKLVATNLGLFEPTGDGFLLREIAPGVTVDEVRAATGSKLTVPDNLPTVPLVG